MSDQRQIIIDIDPGIDDAIALLLAFACPDDLSVLGVTTIHGNKPVEKTTANARRILDLANRPDIAVYRGCAMPLLAPSSQENDFHGADGLGDIGLPNPSRDASDQHAVDFIIDTVMAAPARSVTLCAVGPLTNVALALKKEPRLQDRLAELLIMGGAISPEGRPPDLAEFNFKSDPAAAHVVLSSNLPISLFPLDVTRKTVVIRPLIEALEGASGRVPRAAAAMLRFALTTDPCLHDACVIAHMLRPGMFSGHPAEVAVEWRAQDGEGISTLAPKPVNRSHYLVTDLDKDAFTSLLAAALTRLE